MTYRAYTHTHTHIHTHIHTRTHAHTLHGHVRTCMHIIANLARSTRSTNITKEICQKSKIMYIPISMELDGISHKKDVEVNFTEEKPEKRAGSCKIMTYYCGFPYPRLM